MAGRSHSARSGWFAVPPFGAQQTLHPGRRKEMRETLVAAGIPFADVNVIFVSTVEFLFGPLLIFGAFTPLACIMLGGVMIVAIATSAIKNIKAPPLLGWLSEFLDLPEVL
jgi:uncharacterized membrane protein YphA (DoxX/SURF4 family)